MPGRSQVCCEIFGAQGQGCALKGLYVVADHEADCLARPLPVFAVMPQGCGDIVGRRALDEYSAFRLPGFVGRPVQAARPGSHGGEIPFYGCLVGALAELLRHQPAGGSDHLPAYCAELLRSRVVGVQHKQHPGLAQGPPAAFSLDDAFGGGRQPAALVGEPCELQVPDDRFCQVPVEQLAGVFEVAHEQSDGEAGHGEVLAAVEEHGDDVRERDAGRGQLIADALEGLQRAHAGVGADSGAAVPGPHMVIADVDAAGPGDAKFRPVCVEFAVIDRSAVAAQACQRAHAREGGVIEHAVEDGGAVAEVGLEQHHERSPVPCCQGRHAEGARVVVPDAVLVEAGPVLFLVKVVGLGQLREEPAPAGSQR